MKISVPRIAGGLLLVGALLVSVPLSAATITVGGGCTLADAINSANSDSAVGACTAGSGADRIVLTSDITLTSVDNGANGLPEVTTEVTIVGNGFTLSRAAGSPGFRLLSNTAAGSLRIEDLTLTGGGVAGADDGGAILNTGDLTLVDSSVLDNHSGDSGGGIANKTDGSTTLINTTVSGNTASDFGGGIYSDFDSPVVISDSTISGNEVSSIGDGGGIFSYAGVAISNSTITGNYAGFRGGGIGTLYAYSFLIGNSMVDTEVSNNVAGFSGGGIYSGPGSSEILVNVTVSGNEAGNRGGGMYNEGYGEATVTHSTFSGNAAPTGAGINDKGAGITMTNSIVANSIGENCEIADLTDGGGNFDDDGTCPGAGTITNLDPVLADNGGPHRTHALLAGSSAIDAGGDCGLPADQRGYGRDAACDSGAFEFDGAPPVGGSAGGLDAPRLRCSNLTTGESIQVTGLEVWNCRQVGLAIASGDEVRMQVSGKVIAPQLPAAIEGILGGRVRCRNITTGDMVQFPLGGATTFDCQEEGLDIFKRDRVMWMVVGTAE